MHQKKQNKCKGYIIMSYFPKKRVSGTNLDPLHFDYVKPLGMIQRGYGKHA